MIVFLLLSVPCWLLFLNSFFHNDGIRKRDYFIPLGKGAVYYVVALLLSWFFSDKLVLGQVTPVRVFFYDFRYYGGMTSALWLLIYSLFHLGSKNRGGSYRFREVLLFLGAAYFGESLYRAIISESWYGLYELYFFPLGNLAMIVMLALLLVRMDGASLPGKALLFILSLFVVFLHNVVPALFTLNRPFAAAIIGSLLFVLSLILFRAELGGNLPGSSGRY